MRFEIICFISLLLAPTIAASSPPPPNPPLHPYPNSPPSHGDLVGYAQNGLHAGIVVGSPSRQGGNVDIAPLAPPSKNQLSVHHHLVVSAHPDNILTTGISSQHTASEAARHHEQHPPSVSHPTGPYPGSANYRAPASGRRTPQRHARRRR
ncbi:hypothetical protein M378DRAFT_738573 [Amanita muscaria Koide BX008]|uniref:Uncharacterized protein n=1 Tax=Amanita muscaria (strain Koide BX008) TaxID=946122 RepID=A0A0C2WMQ7_AMAMK|nr:hypothetical protein M378DRAFT_738573 [Amanita muscaria Koide BX008]